MRAITTAPRFSMALQALTDHVRSEVVVCAPVMPLDRECMYLTLEAHDPHRMLAAIKHMVDSYRFTTTHYMVSAGEDPSAMQRLGYIIYLRPAPGDRAKLPPQVYYLSTK